MSVLTINVNVDLQQMTNLVRYSKKYQPILVRTAADRYLKYLRNRFEVFSSGGGNWPQLDPDETIPRKERRGAPDPELILFEFGEVYEALGIRIISGVTRVGYVRDQPHSATEDRVTSPTVNELVKIHAAGEGYLPERKIIESPTNLVRNQMLGDVKKEYEKAIRANRRKK